MTRPDCSPFFYPFIAKLSLENQEFVAAHKLFKSGWQDRVPAHELLLAIEIQKVPFAYLDSLVALCRKHQLAMSPRLYTHNQHG
jgi:hypothetical protein